MYSDEGSLCRGWGEGTRNCPPQQVPRQRGTEPGAAITGHQSLEHTFAVHWPDDPRATGSSSTPSLSFAPVTEADLSRKCLWPQCLTQAPKSTGVVSKAARGGLTSPVSIRKLAAVQPLRQRHYLLWAQVLHPGAPALAGLWGVQGDPLARVHFSISTAVEQTSPSRTVSQEVVSRISTYTI